MTYKHIYTTTLNGGIVEVELDLSISSYMPRLVAVWFDDVNVYDILDKATITALDMEAERALSGDLPSENLPSMGQFSR